MTDKKPRRALPALLLILLFVLGLALGLGLYFNERRATEAALKEASRLRSEVKNAQAEIDRLEGELRSAETTIQNLIKASSEPTDGGEKETQGSPEGEASTPSSSAHVEEIVERSVSPEVVSPGGQMTLSVRLKGTADSAEMQIVGTGFDQTYTLSFASEASGYQTWTASINAPSTPGMYRYYAKARAGSTEVEMPGVSAWSFLVE